MQTNEKISENVYIQHIAHHIESGYSKLMRKDAKDEILEGITLAISEQIKSLKSRLKEVEKELENYRKSSVLPECPMCGKMVAIIDDLEGLRKRLSQAEAELKEWRDDQASCMNERCGDEVHCSCVPSLRREVKSLEQKLSAVATEEWDALKQKLSKAEAELAELKRFTHCAYCNESFPLDTVTAEQVGEHIHNCPKHPIAVYKARLSNLMDVGGKMAGALENIGEYGCTFGSNAKLAISMWEKVSKENV